MVASVSVFLPPPLPEAVLIKALNVRVHIGGLAEECSGGLLSEGTLTQSDSATWLTLSSVGGTVGGVLHMFSQNRHY